MSDATERACTLGGSVRGGDERDGFERRERGDEIETRYGPTSAHFSFVDDRGALRERRVLAATTYSPPALGRSRTASRPILPGNRIGHLFRRSLRADFAISSFAANMSAAAKTVWVIFVPIPR